MIDSNKYKPILDDVNATADNLYRIHFEEYLSDVRDLHNRMQSKVQPITDKELEDVLTVLPLNLFTASEALNKLKLEQEVLKLQIKKQKVEVLKNIPEKSSIPKTDFVASEMADYEVLVAVYTSVISRAESEMSYCKELIMGCKKIWDGRRSTERSNPVSEVVTEDLPDYQKDVYIK